MDVLAHLGIDAQVLPDQFAKDEVPGRTLILDGDGPAYVITSKVKRLDTAIRQYQMEMLTQMYLCKAEFIEVHLTSSRCLKFGRHEVMAHQPYQGNRKNKEKPPLLEPLREALQLQKNWLPEMEVILHRDHEADDGMIISAHRLGDSGVTWSQDKDLRCTPFPYFEQHTGLVMPGEKVGKLWKRYTPAGACNVEGLGPLFFWAQMLMGDTADNVKGLTRYNGKLIGKTTAYDVLHKCQTVSEAANIVFDAYREAGQNILAEGWMLHLIRHPHDSFWVYAHECGLSQANQEFIQWCAKQRWRLGPGEKRDHDKGKWSSEIYRA